MVGSLLEQARPCVLSFSDVRQGLLSCPYEWVSCAAYLNDGIDLIKSVSFSSGIALALPDEPCNSLFDPYN